jgi:hypothetical protein
MLIRAALIIIAVYWTGYWVAGAAVAVLMFVWATLGDEEGPPVLALALTYQWAQVSIGVFYSALIGEPLETMYDAEWQTMMLIGLGCVICLTISVYYGIVVTRRRLPPPEGAPPRAFSTGLLYAAYGASLLMTGAVQELAWAFPAFTQAILAITYSHLALLFLLLRRLMHPTLQWEKVIGLIALEVALGFTGYFAGFREPLIMAAIAVIEVFDRRDGRHWAFMVTIAIILGFSSLTWITVRGELRQEMDDEVVTATRAERFERARTVTTGVLTDKPDDYVNSMQTLIERIWAIHYPALALERVPLVVPYEDGQLMRDALVHLVTPRFLYPDKPDLPSDSELVRKYSGAYVAGAEENTSIAFGYAAESYVDFGVPLMFVPVLIWGFLLGAAYQMWLHLIRHRDLAVALVTVMFWMSLYMFERSWVKTLGGSVTMMVYLGGLTFLVDQWLVMRRAQQLTTGLDDPLLGTGS